MGHHEKKVIDPNATYEVDSLNLKYIIGFGVGIAVLSILSFGLMWVFMDVLREGSDAIDQKNAHPMAQSSADRLPPEPRLQAAPGFGVDGPNGRVNMELTIPQAEYRELEKRWNEELKHGVKDAKTGTVVKLPIEEAKKKVLEGVRTVPAEQAQKSLEEATGIVSASSAGRKSSEKRR